MFRKVRPKWYTNKVQEKRNETWSIQDRLLVQRLRIEEHKSVNEVVEILKNMGRKADKITVYNLTRENRKALLGKCYKCGTNLSPEEIKSKKQGRILFLCTECKREAARIKKERRDDFLARGLCGTCGKKPHLPDHKSCKGCLSSVHRRRIAKGLCGTCGKRPIDESRSIHQCTICLEMNLIRTANTRINLVVG